MAVFSEKMAVFLGNMAVFFFVGQVKDIGVSKLKGRLFLVDHQVPRE